MFDQFPRTVLGHFCFTHQMPFLSPN